MASQVGHPDVVEVLLEKGGGADLAKMQTKVSALRRNISDNGEGDGCFVGGGVWNVFPMLLFGMWRNTRREGGRVGRKEGRKEEGKAGCIERHIF